MVDAHGLPIEVETTSGQITDCTQAPALISKLPAAKAVVADKDMKARKSKSRTSDKGLSRAPEKA